MNFKITKGTLVSALERATTVATKSIKANFQDGNRIRFVAKNDALELTASNGHIDFYWQADKNTDSAFELSKDGSVIVEADKALQIISTIGGAANKDKVLEVSVTDSSEMLTVKDITSSRSKVAQIQSLKECRDVQAPVIKKSIFQHKFQSDDFVDCVNTVAPYTLPGGYKVRFQMVVMHFFSNEVRFVAGNPSRFAVYWCPNTSADISNVPTPPAPTNEDGEVVGEPQDPQTYGAKFMIPADLAMIVCKVVKSSTDFVMTYVDRCTCHFQTDDGVKLVVNGIPDCGYTMYERHAFNFSEAKTIIDVEARQFNEGCQLVGSVRDKEIEKAGSFLSADFIAEKDSLRMIVNERKYKADFSCDAQIYAITADRYKSHYSHEFLEEVASATSKDFIRFYCIDERKTILCEPVNIDDKQRDQHGVPLRLDDSNGRRLVFFFAAVKNKV